MNATLSDTQIASCKDQHAFCIEENLLSGANFMVTPTQIGPGLCWFDDGTMPRMSDEQALMNCLMDGSISCMRQEI